MVYDSIQTSHHRPLGEELFCNHFCQQNPFFKPTTLFSLDPADGFHFLNGASTRYNNGLRGGKVKIRARIVKTDKRTLSITEIPYGQTMTYGEIANIIAKQKGVERMSAQAVGGAVGHNPISIIIPCHRVVGTNGSLTGYAGGLDKKTELLKLEKSYDRTITVKR